MKVTALLPFSLLYGANAGSWCGYQCNSQYPNVWGHDNLAPGAAGLPFFRTVGFSPSTSLQLCETDSDLSAISLHPLPTTDDIPGGLVSSNFLALCPTEKALKLFHAGEDSIEQRSIVDIGGDQEVVGFSEVYGNILVTTTDRIVYYSMTTPFEGGITKIWEHISENAVFEGIPIYTGKYAVAFSRETVVAVPLDLTAPDDVVTISTGFSNSINYAVADGDQSTVFFCSNEGIHKLNIGTKALDTINLSNSDLTCTSLLLTGESLIFSATLGDGTGSILGEVDLADFEEAITFGTYEEVISGVSRRAYIDSQFGPVAFLTMSTDKGIQVAVEQFSNFSKGTLYSQFDIADAVVGRPTITMLAEPVVFSTDRVVAFTDSFTVSYFSPEFIGLPAFSQLQFLASPLLLGPSKTVGITKNGLAVLFKECARFTLGTTPPENACPVGDLPDTEEIPTWMLLTAGAGAVFAIPVLGDYLTTKMKVCGHEEEEEDDNDDMRPRKRDPLEGIVLTPVRPN